MLPTPILFLIFNRPDTTEQVFNAIKKAKPSKLYIAADGARKNKEGEADLCAKTREIALRVDWECEVKTLFRDRNLGCKIAVSNAIDWFFKHEEEGIILEDDTLPDETFFTFCSTLLERYRDQPDVMHISGVNFQFGIERGQHNYYFSKFPLIWGWATWRRAWENYSNDIHDSEKEIEEILSPNFNQKGDFDFYFDIIKKVKNNLIDTWDYQWVYTMLKFRGISIVPQYSLVQNIGFDNRATHTSNAPSWLKYMKYSTIKDISSFPDKKANDSADMFYLSICRNESTFTLHCVKILYSLKRLWK